MGDYYHYCDYCSLGSRRICCLRARLLLARVVEQRQNNQRALVMLEQVCAGVVLASQRGRLPPGTHWRRIFTLQKCVWAGNHKRHLCAGSLTLSLCCWRWKMAPHARAHIQTARSEMADGYTARRSPHQQCTRRPFYNIQFEHSRELFVYLEWSLQRYWKGWKVFLLFFKVKFLSIYLYSDMVKNSLDVLMKYILFNNEMSNN